MSSQCDPGDGSRAASDAMMPTRWSPICLLFLVVGPIGYSGAAALLEKRMSLQVECLLYLPR